MVHVRQILVDACGWVAVVDGKMNLDRAMDSDVGTFNLLLLRSIEDELVQLSAEKGKPLLIDLLLQRAERIEPLAISGSHADDQIHDLAVEHGWTTLTVDKRLKQRLRSSGCPVIEATKTHRLRLVD